MYAITKMLISQNRSGKGLEAKGITLHETANPGATAMNHYNYFNGGYRGASAHAFVDWTSIIQTVPYQEQAWHAGPTANASYIGIEMCRPSTHDVTKFNNVYNQTVWYVAKIFVDYLNIRTITNTNLVSHAYVSNTWRETDHQDPISYLAEYGKSMDTFRADVQSKINELTINVTDATGVKIVINTDKLNVRSQPNTSSSIIGALVRDDKVWYDGVTSNGWYRFKTGDGVVAYVSGTYLGDVPPAAPIPPTPPEMTIEEAKTIIQSHIGFSNPDAWFDYILAKEFGKEMIIKWAKSYTK